MVSFNRFTQINQKIRKFKNYSLEGEVSKVSGLIVESLGPPLKVGDLCSIERGDKRATIEGEVIGFNEKINYIMPFNEIDGVYPGALVRGFEEPIKIPIYQEFRGKVLDGLGRDLVNRNSPQIGKMDIHNKPPSPLSRKRIKDVLTTGVKAIDGCLTVGKGQRMGIFSGSGVGKSTLMGMIARENESDINVICLLGERGREVKEFIEKDLGKNGLSKTVMVVVTSDQSALMKWKAAYTATRIAEYYRDKGKHVLFMMDSLTRFALAGREIGLSLGEPPTAKGFTPFIFSELPKLLERTGSSEKGTITAFYTVLVEGDDFNEPISDAARSILDGHLVLQRRLASEGHYPAIDICDSISRLGFDICSEEHWTMSQKIKELVSIYQESQDLINIGAYVQGSNESIDQAINHIPKIKKFLKQNVGEKFSSEETINQMKQALVS